VFSACGFGYTPVRSGAAEQRRMTAIFGGSTAGGHKAHPLYIEKIVFVVLLPAVFFVYGGPGGWL